MGIALLSAQRSKDASTQVGACIVSRDKKILSVGYNGMPTGCSDDDMPWEREGSMLESKYAFVCHAELNAIPNRDGGTKAIIQSGIKEVVYLDDKYKDTEDNIAARKMMDMAGVTYRKYIKSEKDVVFKL